MNAQQEYEFRKKVERHRAKHGKLNYSFFKGLLNLFGLGSWHNV